MQGARKDGVETEANMRLFRYGIQLPYLLKTKLIMRDLFPLPFFDLIPNVKVKTKTCAPQVVAHFFS